MSSTEGARRPTKEVHGTTDNDVATVSRGGFTHVVSQVGNRINIRAIRALHVGSGNPSPMMDDDSKYYHVIAEMMDEHKEGEMVELRRNLHEVEAREYCKQFTNEGIDFVYWDDGRKWLNPNYIDPETVMMLPNFICDE